MVVCYFGLFIGYFRYVDNLNKDGRVIICIYYFNKDWDLKVSEELL